MQSPMRLGLTLMILCALAAGLLAFTDAQTRPIIAKNDQAKLEAALKELLPQAQRFETTQEGDKTFYQGYQGDKEVGVVAVFPQKGFGGFMKLMLGVSSDGKITGFRVLEHSETPGLGARITEAKFQEQFVGKSVSDPFQVGKDVQAISGATISSRSVAGGLKLVAGEIEKKFLAKSAAALDIKRVPDGEYQGEAEGFEGPIKVTVKVAGGKIVDIKVAEQHETPEVGGKALPELTKRLVDAQSINVDNVSGATFTSEGVKAAVQNALSKFATAGPAAALDLSKLADGTYKGTGSGFGGDINVEVTVRGGKITDIKADAANETPEVGGAAIKKLIEEIKAQQKLDVDVVSGATFSSQGFLDAVRNALKG
ncbi:MAG: H+/Na+-translocating ferredoxin:NAD+ oxidoreductase subunit [Bacillota bacterium]|nr:H+/Na+-translocating ferredoxin:NAD+ oxidoreductase subunit [Bacillota bacterium]MDK2856648.1 H+/Na+-translocating ferredoxin:NAD+ oxidoreductase subunit [Bacillota bacterium]MDK2925663.1 H+/Na+-translocating ferredoxin:NAD+ oxidoreductase subunit [Bacillota bacterium]